MDQVHFLRLSHAPDLFYLPEIIAFIVLGIIGFAWRRKLIEIGSPWVLFTASCALMLVVVFNQLSGLEPGVVTLLIESLFDNT